MSLKSIEDLDALVARTTVDELAIQTEKLNEHYRGLLGVAGATYRERVRKTTEHLPSPDEADVRTMVTRALASSAFTSFTQTLTREKARLRVAMGLITVRRWQLAHGAALPPSMETAAKEAGLRSPRLSIL